MKIRDSGMPDENLWESFFSPEEALTLLGLDAGVREVAEFGSGYGTFTLAAARLTPGTVYAFDIEPEMIARVCRALPAGRRGQCAAGSPRTFLPTAPDWPPARSKWPCCSISSTTKTR